MAGSAKCGSLAGSSTIAGLLVFYRNDIILIILK